MDTKIDYFDINIKAYDKAKQNIKFHTAIYDIKTIYDTKHDYNYANIFYENKKPKWISISFIFNSADGEFREFFGSYDNIHSYFKNETHNLSVAESYYKKIQKHLHYEDIDYVLVLYVFILNFIKCKFLPQNHIYYNVFIKIQQLLYDQFHLSNVTSCIRFENSINAETYLCIKSIPLSLYDLKNINSINSSFKKELFINYLCRESYEKKICTYFGLLIDWKIIKNNNNYMYSSSKIRKRIVDSKKYLNHVKTLFKLGNQVHSDIKDVYRNKLTTPISFAEKHMVYTDYHLLLLFKKEYSTLYNFIKNKKLSVTVTQTEPQESYISSMVFQLCYSLLCLNVKVGCIHGDLHLNNVLVELFDRSETFTVNINNSYYHVDSKCKFSIIDFGRSILSYNIFLNYFPEELNFYLHEKQKIIGLCIKILPHFYATNQLLLDSLINNYPDQVFKLMSGLDLIYFITLYKNEHNTLEKNNVNYLDDILSFIYNYMNENLAALKKNPNTELQNIYYLIIENYFKNKIPYNTKDYKPFLNIFDTELSSDNPLYLEKNIINLKNNYENYSKSEKLFFK